MQIKLTGTGYWINNKNYKEWPRPDGTVDKSWSMVLRPDKESLATIQELQMRGLKNRLKRTEDGEISISLGRKVEKMIKGKIVAFDPPKVYDLEGKETDVDVGNGSKVEVDLNVYEHNIPGSKQKSVAARWDSVKILDLIEYKSNKSPEAATEAIW